MKKSKIIGKAVHLEKMGWCELKETNDGLIYEPLDKNKAYGLTGDNMDGRTLKQNSSLWQYVTILAKKLNDAGLSVQKVMKWELSWSKDSAKEFLWNPIMMAIYKKSSSTTLKKNELTEIHKYLDLKMQEKGLEHIPFPSIESMMMDKWVKEN